jgi:subtilisin family serine protease
MDGVANSIRIMSVRTVPNGDERDKDVANAIRYAVDNGAEIINMSFGKSYSYNKKIVDEAVKHAEKKGVLLVHAAGNDSKNIDVEYNFPTKFYQSGNDAYKRGKKSASNWIEVGALSWKGQKDAPAVFSNYGKTTVDIFAPGVDINSTIPEGKYKPNSGTSMAAPVVAGVAALVKSYYPELTAAELKICLESSVTKVDYKVTKPGTAESVDFKDLCIQNGVVNAYSALKKAEEMVAKKAK